MSAPFAFQYEVTAEGLKKRAAIRNIPKAQRYCLERWLAGTVTDAKRSAAAMQASGRGRKTGELARNIGMDVQGSTDNFTGLVGTGVKTKSVVYARIQDQGGVTHPTVTPKLRRFMFAKFHETGDEKFKWIALTKKQRLDVRIPASYWFTSVIEKRTPLLNQAMQPAEVLRVAEAMGSK